VENFESINEAYVVEDYDCACLIENIEMLAEQADGNSGVPLTTENIQEIVSAAVQGVLSGQASTGNAGSGA
jgi:hypothetical protein